LLLEASTNLNQTNGSEIWRERTEGILNHTLAYYFSRNNTAYEVPCEGALNCTPDMFSFKAYLTRWMAAATKVAPFITDRVMLVLRASAINAALQCSGGENGRMCGLSWVKGSNWDGTFGVGQQMAAMEVIQSNLIQKAQVPFTNTTGGTSQGDPSAGSNSPTPQSFVPPTKADKIGAGFLTTIILLGCISLFSFMTFGK
jgi:mannan endo-1,6-alpha-mannosidase